MDPEHPDRQHARLARHLDALARTVERIFAKLQRRRRGQVRTLPREDPRRLLVEACGLHHRPEVGRLLVHPAGARLGERIGPRDVGLDVEDRRAVDEVRLVHRQPQAVDGQQPDAREADRIRAVRAAGGEDAHAAAVARRHRRTHRRTPSAVAVEVEDEPEALEAGKIAQRLLEAAPRLEFDDAGTAGIEIALTRHVVLPSGLGAVAADRLKRHGTLLRIAARRRRHGIAAEIMAR